jgi:hypothetical protein
MKKPTPRAIMKIERAKLYGRRRWWVDADSSVWGKSLVALHVRTTSPQPAASVTAVPAQVLKDRRLLASYIKMLKASANRFRAENIASYPYPLKRENPHAAGS